MMMILDNKETNKVIKYKISDTMTAITDKSLERVCYSPKLPVVFMTNKEDAEELQKQVNTFVNKLCQELLSKPNKL